MLRAINYETAAYIYDKWLVKHFPGNEVKPLINIKNMWEIGGYEAYAWYEGEELIGYAFMCGCPDGDCILLDYLAILDEHRAEGYGSKILLELKNVAQNKKALVIETENIDTAASQAEVDERIRRDRFYTGNGVVKSGLTATVYDADYRVWYLPIAESFTDAELMRVYDNIYKFMLSDKGYRDFFKIHKNRQ